MQIYMICNNLNDWLIVLEEDLIIDKDGDAMILLRFRNCTGNIIKLLGK